MPDEPATKTEIAVAIGKLLRAVPAKTGVKASERLEGFLIALEGFPLAAIETTIMRYLRGETELSRKYCPLPPELAAVVRSIAGRRVDATTGETLATSGGRSWAYRAPTTKVIQRNVTREYGRQLVNGGVLPHGSIWCPNAEGERHFGDVYAPDPYWKGPTPWPPSSHADPYASAGQGGTVRPVFDDLQRMPLLDFTGPRYEPPGAEPRQIPDYSQAKVDATDKLKANIEAKEQRRRAEDGEPPFGGL